MNNTPVTKGQAYSMKSLMDKFWQHEDGQLFILSRLIGRKVKDFSDVKLNEWIKLRDKAFPKWTQRDWSISKDFKRICQSIAAEYEEEVAGQTNIMQILEGD
jgi:hypothetical protein